MKNKKLFVLPLIALVITASSITFAARTTIHVYTYESSDRKFADIEVPAKGKVLDIVQKHFQEYKKLSGKPNVRLFRTFERNPLAFYQWLDYLTHERWNYPFMAPSATPNLTWRLQFIPEVDPETKLVNRAVDAMEKCLHWGGEIDGNQSEKRTKQISDGWDRDCPAAKTHAIEAFEKYPENIALSSLLVRYVREGHFKVTPGQQKRLCINAAKFYKTDGTKNDYPVRHDYFKDTCSPRL